MATNRITITETELLDAIASTMSVSDASREAKTAKELSAQSGLSVHSVMLALHAYAKQGRLVVHRVKRESVDLTWRTRVAYTVSPKKR